MHETERDDLRTELAAAAARLIAEDGLDYAAAKQKAATLMGMNARSRSGLPDNAEVELELRRYLSTFMPQQRSVLDAIVNRAAAVGAPWITFFEPSMLTAELLALGFAQVKGMGPEETTSRYFADRKDNLRVAGFGHVMKATV